MRLRPQHSRSPWERGKNRQGAERDRPQHSVLSSEGKLNVKSGIGVGLVINALQICLAGPPEKRLTVATFTVTVVRFKRVFCETNRM